MEGESDVEKSEVYIADINSKIKKRRQQLGMSQEELAKKLGCESRSSINKIEKGHNDIPRVKVKDFAKALDLPAEYLMGFGENERSKGEYQMSNTEVRITESLFQKLQEEISEKDARIAELEKELVAHGKEYREQPKEYNFKAKMAQCINTILDKTEWNQWDHAMLIETIRYFSNEERISYSPESSLRSNDAKES